VGSIGRIARRRRVVVGTQHRQHDSAVGVEVPVDVKKRGERRTSAVLENVAPPPVLFRFIDAEVIGHDVDDQPHPAGPGRSGQPFEPLRSAKRC